MPYNPTVKSPNHNHICGAPGGTPRSRRRLLLSATGRRRSVSFVPDGSGEFGGRQSGTPQSAVAAAAAGGAAGATASALERSLLGVRGRGIDRAAAAADAPEATRTAVAPAAAPVFPLDFFEHTQLITPETHMAGDIASAGGASLSASLSPLFQSVPRGSL